MSNLPTAVAIFVPDLHLSDKQPRGRNEPNWIDYQIEVMREIAEVVEKYTWNAVSPPPVVYVGDVFHRPDPSAELINAALEHLPKGYGIPGQHDLLHHNYMSRQKTGYWTLHTAGVIENLFPGQSVTLTSPFRDIDVVVKLHGFPWGMPMAVGIPSEAERLDPKVDMNVAVVHEYAWHRAAQHYQGAEDKHPEGEAPAILKRFQSLNFTHIFTGDNHTPFYCSAPGDRKKNLPEIGIWNGGTVMARSRNERGLATFASILMSDGLVKQHPWDHKKDQWKSPEVELAEIQRGIENRFPGLDKLLDRLNKTIDARIDFLHNLKNAIVGEDVELTAILAEIINETETER